MKEITVCAVRTDTVRQLDPAVLEAAMPERAEKARRFRFEKDRLLCLGAGFLMMSALGIRSGKEILPGKNGKPYAPGYPAFSLSHSGEWCILASGAGNDIGADIEEIDEKQTGIAPEVYTAAERSWMEEDPVNRFFQLWTWKESVMKATGLGMELAPGSFEVLPFAEGREIRLLDRQWYAQGGFWDHCAFSVCADEPAERIRWRILLPGGREAPCGILRDQS